MDKNELYSRTIERLRNTNPKVDNIGEEVKRILELSDIYREVSGTKGGDSATLFSWTNNLWARTAFSVAAILLGAVFLIQQVYISNRVREIETHLKAESVASVMPANSSMPTRLHLAGISMGLVPSDSMMVSSDDLRVIIYELEQVRVRTNGSDPILEKYKRLLRSRLGTMDDWTDDPDKLY